MLAAAPQLKSKDTWRYDLVDIARQGLADLSIPFQHDITVAYEKGDKEAVKKTGARFLELAADMDRLLGTRKEFLFGKWVADAKACGVTPEQKKLYEYNARLLPTVWGPSKPNALLFDYSNRQWSGLIKGYYIPRWQRFLAYLDQQPADGPDRFTSDQLKGKLSYGRPGDVANDFYKGLSAWEQKWCEGTEIYPDKPTGDSIAIAAELYKKWQPSVAEAFKRYNPQTLQAGDGGDAAIYGK